MYPLNHSQTPALTPPTPPQSISPTEPDFSSFSHPSAPPSLATLPARQASDNNSQILVTPNEIAARHQMARTMGPGAGPPLEETLVLDPVLTSSGSQRNSSGSDGYFEGVVGLKQDGTALIEKNVGSSPYARYPNSPSTNLHPHPYRRPSTLTSPNRGMSQQHSSPTLQYHPAQRSFSPSNLANDGKPVFAMPFPPQNGGYGLQQQDGMLAPPIDMGTKMEKQGSADGDPTTWQRWSVSSICGRQCLALTKVGTGRRSLSRHRRVSTTTSTPRARPMCRLMPSRTCFLSSFHFLLERCCKHLGLPCCEDTPLIHD